MRQSAGILVFKRSPELQFFLVHPGGPFWAKKDEGAWSIPKGEFGEGESPLEAAKREFKEETGQAIEGNFVPLTPITQKGGKRVLAWAVEAEIDPEKIVSNEFQMEWPPKSGHLASFPEVDRAAWFPVEIAGKKINPGQALFLEEILRLI